MVRIVVNGVLGHMGREVLSQAGQDHTFAVVAGVDQHATEADASGLRFALFTDIEKLREKVDVVVDFSHPTALPALLAWVTRHGVALVLGTTGYSAADRGLIEAASQKVPIFMAPNMAYGVAVLADLVAQAAKALGPTFDAEIVETHHRRKVDSPSGTALMLADRIASARPEPSDVVLDRPARHAARVDREIGVVARRGGTVAGEHIVGFFGDDEIIEIRHTAQSRRIMAAGSLRAAHYVVGKKPGLYSMDQLLAEQSLVTHIGLEPDVAVLSLADVPASPADIAALFDAIGHVNVDMISATTPHEGRLDLAFSVPQADLGAAVQALAGKGGEAGRAPRVTEHLAKLTVEGEGMASTPGVTARVFHCLADSGVSPCQVTTSETKITMAVDAVHAAKAVQAIRAEFGLG